PLRSRRDELPSLASLYLSSLNAELGKQIIGFDPRASEQLLQYDWPNNYTQFKQVLQELVTLTDSAYIRGSAVAEVLARERSTYHSEAAVSAPAAEAARSEERRVGKECRSGRSACEQRDDDIDAVDAARLVELSTWQ